MARPIKKGLDYFPVDTDIFDNIQVRKLKSRYKASGFLIYFTILCDVYKKEGYFLQLSDDYVYDLSDRIGETEERVQEVISFCLQTDLFNRRIYELYKIITSKSIQERYILARNRNCNPIREDLDCINATETSVIVAEITENTAKSAQKKRKENKVNIESESAREEPIEIPEKSFDEKCAAWQKELLKDEEWCASSVRQSGLGTDFHAMLPAKMQEFQDFIIANNEKESICSKQDYARRFYFWWLYHGLKKYSGGNQPGLLVRGKEKQKSRIEEIIDLGKSSTELALQLYKNAV